MRRSVVSSLVFLLAFLAHGCGQGLEEENARLKEENDGLKQELAALRNEMDDLKAYIAVLAADLGMPGQEAGTPDASR